MGHLLVSATHKSSGKTTVTLGLCRALTLKGHKVQPFKKGPDYIDPMWLTHATGRTCLNLDFNTMERDEILAGFARYRQGADLSLVEGNMGLFDSLDVEGSNSNAALAAVLGAPVVLVVDVRGMTRSVAPLVLGFQHFDPGIRIGGLILNKVAGARHEEKLRAAIAHYTDLPVLGAIRRDPALTISERHLGLVPSNETREVESKLDALAAAIGDQVDLDGIMALASDARLPDLPDPLPLQAASPATAPRVRIGLARDAAFGFYYPDDLLRLVEAGAELVEFDTLHDTALPAVDGLFIGGGFPETQMDALAANTAMRRAIREAIEAGLPVYAECGGLMYLTRSLRWEGNTAEMVGVLPADTVMYDRPQGVGYVRLRETGAMPWSAGQDGAGPVEFNAHEFHYSRLENLGKDLTFAYEVHRGTGIDGRHDGIVYKNLLANYAHLRDINTCHWARRFVDFVRSRSSGASRRQGITPLSAPRHASTEP